MNNELVPIHKYILGTTDSPIQNGWKRISRHGSISRCILHIAGVVINRDKRGTMDFRENIKGIRSIFFLIVDFMDTQRKV